MHQFGSKFCDSIISEHAELVIATQHILDRSDGPLFTHIFDDTKMSFASAHCTRPPTPKVTLLTLITIHARATATFVAHYHTIVTSRPPSFSRAAGDDISRPDTPPNLMACCPMDFRSHGALP